MKKENSDKPELMHMLIRYLASLLWDTIFKTKTNIKFFNVNVVKKENSDKFALMRNLVWAFAFRFSYLSYLD